MRRLKINFYTKSLKARIDFKIFDSKKITNFKHESAIIERSSQNKMKLLHEKLPVIFKNPGETIIFCSELDANKGRLSLLESAVT